MTFVELFYYLGRVAKWKLGDRSPLLASIKLTYRCNLKCKHCAWHTLPKTGEASFDKWKEVLYKLFQEGVRVIVFEGGEPTLIKDLSKMITVAKEIGFRVILVTNGTNSLSCYEPDLLLISIEGSEHIHDQIRGKGVWRKVTKNLYNTPIRKVSLTTLSQLNRNEITKMVKELAPFFDGFGFNIIYPCNKEAQQFSLDRIEVEQIYKELLALSEEYDVVNSKGMLSYGVWDCNPWMLVMCEPDGTWELKDECFIKYTGAKLDCTNCHLACYRGFSQLAKGDINSWYLFDKFLFDGT